MKKNLESRGGIHKSQSILLALIKKGLSRKKAYNIVQRAATESWNSNKKFSDILKKDSEFNKYIEEKDLKKIIFSKDNVKHLERIFKSAFKK